MTKILAIQGSPRSKKGNTEIILQKFLEGAQSAGARTETVYLKEKKINPCSGCFTCWTKTPGTCMFRDDMAGLIEKVRDCDIIVFATPLYNYNMTSILKTFQERLLPLLDPHFIKNGDYYQHPPRYETKRKMVLVSNCGFPEITQFDALRHTFRIIEKNGAVPLVGEILVPAGELLRVEPLKELLNNIFAALFRAGVEVVRDGKIARETEEIVQKPIFTPDEIAQMANKIWDDKISI